MVKNSTPKSAVTLIELLIVLVILTALTGIAVQSLEPVADQARYEATQQTLQNVDDAILQQTRDADGTLGYVGFVADLGRLPLGVDVDSDPSLTNIQPVELWTNDLDFDGTPDIVPFLVRDYTDPFTGRPLGSVVASGWRGPYIQPPRNGQQITDGYGLPVQFSLQDGLVVNFGSFGSDGIAGNNSGGAYALDSLAPSGGYENSARYRGWLDVSVVQVVGDERGDPEESTDTPFSQNGTDRLFVRVYGSSPGSSLVANVAPVAVGMPVILANEQLPETADGSFDVVVPELGLPFGTYLVQAVVTNRASFASPPAADGGESIVSRNDGVERVSRLRRVVIKPGITPVTLEIPPPDDSPP